MCVYANQLETTRLLLKRGANIRVATRDKAYTPLCMASLIGNLAMVKLLLEYGASAASESNIDSWTPLHEAALYGHYKVAQVLLEHGADPLARNTERQGRKSPLTLAAEFEQIKLVKLMCNYIDD
jgi:ankyrin repeat protein